MTVIMAVLMALTPPMTIDVPPEGYWDAADATVTAERGTQVQVTETQPPPETWPENVAPPGLDNCQEMSWYRQRAGLPAAFDRIGWRESNCRNEDGVRTSCCHGYWQLHRMHMGGEFGRRCGAWSVNDVNSDNPDDKRRQACSAKLLYDMVGLKCLVGHEMKRPAWIICGGVVYLLSMVALGKYLGRVGDGYPPPDYFRAGPLDWDGR